MKTLSVDATNDIYAKNGVLAVADGLECIRQQCTQAMQTIKGEMLFAADQGIPFFEVVWTGSPNLIAFEAAARESLMRVNGVEFINAFSAAIANNALTYSVEIATKYGALSIYG